MTYYIRRRILCLKQMTKTDNGTVRRFYGIIKQTLLQEKD
jgi:hypothetical protein